AQEVDRQDRDDQLGQRRVLHGGLRWNGESIVASGTLAVLPNRRDLWPIRRASGSIRLSMPLHARRGAVFGGGHPKALAEGSVEGPDGAVAALERDREDGQILCGQPRGGFLQAVAMQEVVEIAVAQLLVDQRAQRGLAHAQVLSEAGQREALAL